MKIIIDKTNSVELNLYMDLINKEISKSFTKFNENHHDFYKLIN
jgi:hypothetical protein